MSPSSWGRQACQSGSLCPFGALDGRISGATSKARDGLGSGESGPAGCWIMLPAMCVWFVLTLGTASFAAELPSVVAEHPIWSEHAVVVSEHEERLTRHASRKGTEATVALLDFLYEARSPVAEGDHNAALGALLEVRGATRRHMTRWIEDLLESVRIARRSGDTVELMQLQTKASVLTSELAGRGKALQRRATRRAAGRALRSLSRFVDEGVWERHVLNPRLRGPMRLGTSDGDRALRRYYRRREHETFASEDRERYVRLLADVEGGVDALNAYDWGGVSLGIAQFAASSPYLGRLLRRVRDDRPGPFEKYVAKRGLTVDDEDWVRWHDRRLIEAIENMSDQNEFNVVLLSFADLLGQQGLFRSLVRHEIALADTLIDRALALEADNGRRLANALGSTRGLAHLTDSFINTGADDTLAAFEAARHRVSESDALVDAFVAARRDFYEKTGQSYQVRRLEAIDAEFSVPGR